jgi:hypothetical protein
VPQGALVDTFYDFIDWFFTFVKTFLKSPTLAANDCISPIPLCTRSRCSTTQFEYWCEVAEILEMDMPNAMTDFDTHLAR